MIIGLSVGAVIVILIVVVLCCIKNNKKRVELEPEKNSEASIDNDAEAEHCPKHIGSCKDIPIGRLPCGCYLCLEGC